MVNSSKSRGKLYYNRNHSRNSSCEIVNGTDNGKDNGKKKRNRHRNRCKKSDLVALTNNCKLENDENVSIVDNIEFRIEAISNPKSGHVYRLRNTKCNYINLKTFIQTTTKPVVFKSIPDQIRNDKKSKRRRSRKRSKHKNRDNETDKITEFPDYWSLEQVELGLKNGELIKGYLRINPKNCKEAYVGNEDTTQSDYIITTVLDRNRALDGDEVVLKQKTQIDNDNDENQDKKQIQVVFISKRNHPRICVGFLKPLKHNKRNKAQEFAELTPRDKRIPRIRIPKLFHPYGFDKNPQLYENCLFSVQITEWNNVNYSIGIILENLGECGSLKVESLAILKEHCLNIEPIPEEFNNIDDIRPELDYENRENLNNLCIFTIDPDTAKDLDDAVSCYQLDNGNFEIGVHISDVTHFLEANTELDEIVQEKATTIYMVDKAYHMLPLKLCLNCSLLPNTDKLTMSIFWEITPNGEIIKQRLLKTVINSCVQLSYNHAQLMIENDYQDLNADDFPDIYNNFTLKHLYDSVRNLNLIAKKLREKRFKNGALRLDQIKISFNLNPTNGEPVEFFVYENKDAHRLIEEFMLLANITVGETLLHHFPDVAFLRLHEPPKVSMLVEIQKILETLGIFIDISTAGSINSSLSKYIGDDDLSKARMTVLQRLFAKSMTRARYFCIGAFNDPDFDYSHYALSIPIYTHFTSPIRRYADIMVHRLLKACLGYCEKPDWTPDFVHSIAENCNRLKYQAKKAGEASCDLYLAHFIENNQPFIEKAVVIDCKEKAIDVIVLKTGSIVRLYTDKFGENIEWCAEEIQTNGVNCKKMWRIFVKFPKTDALPPCRMILEIFSVVTISLERKPKTNKLEGKLVRPS